MAVYTKPLSTNVRSWSDLNLDFIAHPVSKDIVLKTDVEAIKRSVRNLIMTNRYERPFHPEIGSGVRGVLFELISPTTAVILQSEIRQVITNFEPRVDLLQKWILCINRICTYKFSRTSNNRNISWEVKIDGKQ